MQGTSLPAESESWRVNTSLQLLHKLDVTDQFCHLKRRLDAFKTCKRFLVTCLLQYWCQADKSFVPSLIIPLFKKELNLAPQAWRQCWLSAACDVLFEGSSSELQYFLRSGSFVKISETQLRQKSIPASSQGFDHSPCGMCK